MELKAYQAHRNPELDIRYWHTRGLKALLEKHHVERAIIVCLEKEPRKPAERRVAAQPPLLRRVNAVLATGLHRETIRIQSRANAMPGSHPFVNNSPKPRDIPLEKRIRNDYK